MPGAPPTNHANVGMTTGMLTVSDSISVRNIGDVDIGIIATIRASGGVVVNPQILCNDEFVACR